MNEQVVFPLYLLVLTIFGVTKCQHCDIKKWQKSATLDKYFLFQDTRLNCQTAMASCKNLGGQGVILRNHDTEQEVYKLLIESPLNPLAARADKLDEMGCITSPWIGLENLLFPQYRWPDGTPLKSDDYSNWLDGHPSQGPGKCVTLGGCDGREWVSKDATERLPYICEASVPCASRPVLFLGIGRGQYESITTEPIVTRKQTFNVNCFLKGYTGNVKDLRLSSGSGQTVSGQRNFVKQIMVVSLKPFKPEKVSCTATLNDGTRETSEITVILKGFDDQLTSVVKDVDQAIQESVTLDSEYLKSRNILSKLDNITSRITPTGRSKIIGESVLSVVSKITDCCIKELEPESREVLRTSIMRVANNIPLNDASRFVYSSKDVALSVYGGYNKELGKWKSVVFHDKISTGDDKLTVVMNVKMTDYNADESGMAYVHIPFHDIGKSLLQADRSKFRLSVAIFKDHSLFGPCQGKANCKIISRVISAEVPGISMKNLKYEITLTFHQQLAQKASKRCVYWVPAVEGEGTWERDGCTTFESGKTFLTCSCNHMTSFALMMAVDDSVLKHDRLLSILSMVGCTTSAVTLAVTLLTYWMFPFLRMDKPSIILMNICAALLMVNVSFMVNASLIYSDAHNQVLCKCIAMSLHYFMLSALLWMSCDAYYLYMGIVIVFINVERDYIFIFSLISWGIPFFVVLLTGSVQKFENYDLIYDNICWIKRPAIYYAFILPACLLMFFNYVIFATVIQFQIRLSNANLIPENKSKIIKQLKGAVALASLLGMAWIFGILAIVSGHIVFSYLFVIFNTFQGFFIFIFYCVLKPDVNYFWTKLIWDLLHPDTDAPARNEPTYEVEFTTTQAPSKDRPTHDSDSIQ